MSKTTPKRGPKHSHENKSMNKVCKLATDKTQAQNYANTKDILSEKFSFVFVRL